MFRTLLNWFRFRNAQELKFGVDKKLEGDDSKIVKQFLEHRYARGKSRLPKGKTKYYTYTTAEKKKVRYKITADRTVLSRKKPRDNDHPEHIRHDVKGEKNNKLGQGSYGKIFLIEKTLKPDLHGGLHSREKKEKEIEHENIVRKKIVKVGTYAEPEYLQYAQDEYDISKQIPYLGAKELIIRDKVNKPIKSYLVMRKIRGKDLLDIINHHRAELTEEKLLKITINICREMEKLIKKHGILHSDIKPSNIIVDIDTCRVRIIDFGLSEETANPKNISRGTAMYSAPEIHLQGSSPTVASDTFSLGITIGELWGAINLRGKFINRETLIPLIRKEQRSNKVLDFPKKIPAPIETIITAMVHTDPEKRALLKESRKAFEQELEIEEYIEEQEEEETAVFLRKVVYGKAMETLEQLENTKLHDFKEMTSIISQAIDEFIDENTSHQDQAVKYFCHLIGVNYFSGVKSKAAFEAKIADQETFFNDFDNDHKRLKAAEKYLEHLLITAPHFINANMPNADRKNAAELKVKLGKILSEYHSLTYDDKKKTTAQELLKEFEQFKLAIKEKTKNSPVRLFIKSAPRKEKNPSEDEELNKFKNEIRLKIIDYIVDKSSSTSSRRGQDIEALLKVIKNADDKETLTQQVNTHLSKLKTGLFGHSKLRDGIQSLSEFTQKKPK